MSEIEQLKDRIDKSAFDGLETSIIKDDYEPAGQMMITGLVDSGEYISHRDTRGIFYDEPWKVWNKEFSPKY